MLKTHPFYLPLNIWFLALFFEKIEYVDFEFQYGFTFLHIPDTRRNVYVKNLHVLTTLSRFKVISF